MADITFPYTPTDQSSLANLITTAYDQAIRLELRSTPMFRDYVDSRPIAPTQPGSSTVFSFYSGLAAATTPLDENDDPDSTEIADVTRITVTVNQYGAWVVTTDQLNFHNFDNAFQSNIASRLANQQRDTVDALVRAKLDACPVTNIYAIDGGNVVLNGTADGTIQAQAFRQAVTELRGDSVPTWDGVNYVAILHPDVAMDLRIESDAAGWRTPHSNVDTAAIYAGEVGVFEGARFVENPRCSYDTNTKVYNSYVLGKEAVAEAVSEEFHTVVNGRISDPLDRKSTLGWKGTAGWALFRPESLWLVKSLSSLNPVGGGNAPQGGS